MIPASEELAEGVEVKVHVGRFAGQVGVVDQPCPAGRVWVAVDVGEEEMLYHRDTLSIVPPRCRSVSPDGDPCEKPRGHRKQWHVAKGRRWEGGTPKRLARWLVVDDGYRSEADHQSWMRYS